MKRWYAVSLGPARDYELPVTAFYDKASRDKFVDEGRGRMLTEAESNRHRQSGTLPGRKPSDYVKAEESKKE